MAFLGLLLHAHDADGSAFFKLSKPLDGVLTDFCQAAEDIAFPEVGDPGTLEAALKGRLVELLFPATIRF